MTRWLRSLKMIAVLTMACAAAAAAPLPPTPMDVWAGPWVGGYGGGVLANPGGEFSLSGSSLDATPAVVSGLDAAGSQAISARGAVFGLQGGWNWRLDGNLIVGLEGDFGLSGLRGGRATSGLIPVFGVPFTINQSTSIDWQGALRLRAGYAMNDSALAYLQAGPALADLRYASAFADAVNETESVSIRTVEFGLSVGAGAEFAITRNLKLRADYLFSRLPATTGSGTSLLTDGTTAYVAHSSGAVDQNAFRVGLSYYLR